MLAPYVERIFQVGLFLYLLPLVVLALAVGMIGMLFLATARFLPVVEEGPSYEVRNRAGLDSLRS